jgi:DNA-binding MurR/RpiR family transcriptional regulator
MSQLTEIIQKQADRLTPSEQRLVTAVLAQPRQSALATVTDLAREAGVHEATVSRLARKLGYVDYAAFRRALRTEFLPTEETATRLQRSLQTALGSGVLATLVAEETAALANLVSHVDEDQLSRAAELLIGARRIYIFGRGNAEALALMMAKRFRRFGRDVHLLTGDARSLAEGVLGMGQGDVCAAPRAPALCRAGRPCARRGRAGRGDFGHVGAHAGPRARHGAGGAEVQRCGQFPDADRADGNFERHCPYGRGARRNADVTDT